LFSGKIIKELSTTDTIKSSSPNSVVAPVIAKSSKDTEVEEKKSKPETAKNASFKTELEARSTTLIVEKEVKPIAGRKHREQIDTEELNRPRNNTRKPRGYWTDFRISELLKDYSKLDIITVMDKWGFNSRTQLYSYCTKFRKDIKARDDKGDTIN
jgi:hypothetical protein